MDIGLIDTDHEKIDGMSVSQQFINVAGAKLEQKTSTVVTGYIPLLSLKGPLQTAAKQNAAPANNAT